MGRGWKLLLTALATGIVVLAVNAVVTGSETKRAEVNAPKGRILELSSVDLQIVAQPPLDAGARGAPIVLLHCYACSLRWWDEIVPLLRREHAVIRLDLIGHGGSAKPKSGYTIDGQAAAVSEALNRLGLERVTLVGHSMGGSVATSVAARSSELVDRVALIGTTPSQGTGSLPWRARAARTPLLGPAIWRLRPDSMIRSGYESAFAPGFDFEPAFEDPDQVVHDNRAMTYTSYNDSPAGNEAFLEQNPIPSRLTTAGIPVLAILGAEDQIVDSGPAAEQYGTIPGAEVRVLEGVGHSPNLEDPERSAELLLGFAGRLGPEPRAGAGRSGARGPGRGGQRQGGGGR
jgi:pimeloyl-ACP methyl ester carboxylesterase